MMSYMTNNTKYLESCIKQEVSVSCVGIDGMIAKNEFEYKGNKFSIYTKNEEAYLLNRTPGYKHTVCLFNLDNRKSSHIKLMEGQRVKINLDRFV